MRIGIDARFLTHPQLGGFKTYTENLISALAQIDTETEYILYVDRLPAPKDRIPTQKNFHMRIVSGITPLLGLPWREQVGLPRQARKDQVDVFHSPCLTAPLYLSCPQVITVHDMIWASREFFTGNNSWSIRRRLIDWYDYLVPKNAIQKATAIITVSQASKKGIVAGLGMQPDKVFVTYEAASPVFRRIGNPKQLESIRQKYDLPSSYILALGSADPRKNIKSLIHAYGLLPEWLREKHKLAIIWTHPFLAEDVSRLIKEFGLMQNVGFLLQVSNEDLVLLYNAATLFVFPSLYEGFGLPLLEAMSCGVPVIAADNSSIPEIAGDAALYFNALDPQAMAEAMVRMLGDDELKIGLVAKGLAHTSTFSWERCARETVQVYKQAA
jgi:glycosyltransferase involved in cell wall biosynthesis